MLLIVGCGSSIRTFVDYNESVNFETYETFSWISDNPLVAVPGAASPYTFLESQIQESIRSSLTQLGYQFQPIGAETDFTVSFSVGARQEFFVDLYPEIYRNNWRWGRQYIGNTAEVNSITEGTLSIDIFDVNLRSPVWHGRAQKTLSTADQNLQSSIISDAVEEILNEFPPVN